MRASPLERRFARRSEGLRSECEVTDEPDEVNEVPHSRVLDIAWECQGMQLLGDMLADRVDGEPGS